MKVADGCPGEGQSGLPSGDSYLQLQCDELESPGTPAAWRPESRGTRRFRGRLAVIGDAAGEDPQNRIPRRKSRICNATFFINLTLVFGTLVCLGVAADLMTHPRESLADLGLLVLPLLVGVASCRDATRGMRVVLGRDRAEVRGHWWHSTTVPTKEIESFAVKDRLLALKPLLNGHVMLGNGQMVRTPMVAIRLAAGRIRLEEVSRTLNQAATWALATRCSNG